MMILIYGPTGIGKSTAIQQARMHLPQIKFASLDDLVTDLGRKLGQISQDEGADKLLEKAKQDGFLELGMQAAQEFQAMNTPYPVVIDVGAGFLESNKAGEWLSRHDSVVFEATPETAYDRQLSRNAGERRSLACYTKVEFSLQRNAYYKLANRRINAEAGKEEVLRQLLKIIETLIAP